MAAANREQGGAPERTPGATHGGIAAARATRRTRWGVSPGHDLGNHSIHRPAQHVGGPIAKLRHERRRQLGRGFLGFRA
jgi:hypothetical protein